MTGTTKEQMANLKNHILIQDPELFLGRGRVKGHVCPHCGSGSGEHGTGIEKIKESDPAHPKYFCWACHKSMDVIDLFKERHKRDTGEELSFSKALEDLAKLYNLDPESLPVLDIPEREKQETRGRKTFDTDLTTYFANCADTLHSPGGKAGLDYLTGRGISRETLVRFNAGYDPEFIIDPMKELQKQHPFPAIIIPTGKSSCTVRKLNPKNKNDRFYGFTGAKKEPFNLDALNSKEEPIIVTEGAIDAMSVYEAGHHAVIGLSAKGAHKPLINALTKKRPGVPIMLCLDHDEEEDPDHPKKGQMSEQDLFEKLKEINVEVYRENIVIDGCKDPNESLMKDRESFIQTVKAAVQRTLEASNQYHQDLQNAGDFRSLKPEEDLVPADPMKKSLSEIEWIQSLCGKPNVSKWNFFECDKQGNPTIFRHDFMARYLIMKLGIIVLHGRCHTFSNGVFFPESAEYKRIEKALNDIFPDSKTNQRREVMASIRLLADERQEELRDPYLCAFANGVVNLKTGDLMSFNPDLLLTNRIPWDYKPTAYDEITDRFLESCTCGDKELRNTIEEMIGYCFIRSCPFERAFFLTGSGSNGKSVLLTGIENVLGAENVSKLELKDIGNRFRTGLLENKLANIQADISPKDLDDSSTSVFRSVVSGDGMTGEFKGQDPFSFHPYSTLIFSANDIPRLGEFGMEATLRRLIIIPFNAHYTEKTPGFDPDLKLKIQTKEAAEYLIRLGISGAIRLIKRAGFQVSESMKKEVDDYEMMNHPVKYWIKDLDSKINCDGQGKSDIRVFMCTKTVPQAYEEYKAFCRENDIESGWKSMDQFSKEVQNILHLKTDRRRSGSKRYRIFILTNGVQ